MHKVTTTPLRANGAIYRTASRFLPAHPKADVRKLLLFIETARSYVEQQPQDQMGLNDLTVQWKKHRRLPMAQLLAHPSDSVNVRAAKDICRLKITHQLEPSWIDAFLFSLQLDTRPKPYKTIDETLRYMYGSAEAVSLIVAKILGLPRRAMHPASMQGRALQYLDFICQLDHNQQRGRRYLPLEEMRKYHLRSLDKETAMRQPTDFKAFIHGQLRLYDQWQRVAERGFQYMPKRSRAALVMIVDHYRALARTIEKDPMSIFNPQPTPGSVRLLARGLSHLLD